MPCTTCLVGFVNTVSSHRKKHFEEQTLVAGIKQSRQADKAGRPTRQANQQGSWAYLLCLVHATSACSSKWILYQLMHLEQSPFLRYL